METYNNCIVNNNINTLKRKIEDDTIEESHSSKRFHFNHKESPLPITFQLSPSSTANRANDKIIHDEDGMMIDDDSLTDEDDSLEVPAAPPLRNYIAIMDDYMGTLERGWSDLFNEETMNWNE
ncbi:hypothetical protein G6F57_019343 [Rhizopus arrhizus]|uniref:Uncharacterized protein n=1 Tax=Rhizopus oryzae TaxID=64495 RepID=A0A9P6X263_RHIOR|nr:hypothetical protein G6F24_015173 [Rhizopus arrhizus]KAG1240116.1 hypothetical protein G6F68_017976 [Rhizopus microsporus]KAG0758195.1 hypothetical protein G6F22_019721 [Rhizopus arrhizus]KAG0783006.1 hypothetical protein G6F21_010787 [Rhizopus arrhizus]KAG0803195.1 hypothetical protein G6F20_013738 [Rhizopus arrhizus]